MEKVLVDEEGMYIDKTNSCLVQLEGARASTGLTLCVDVSSG